MAQRAEKQKGELLSPFGPPIGPTEYLPRPGWDGPRPLLSFILKVLAGKDRDSIRRSLAYDLRSDFQLLTPAMERAWQTMQGCPETLDWALESMILIMRFAADLWIDSGKSATDRDVDTPSDRNVEDVLPGRTLSLFHLVNNGLFIQFPRYTGMRPDGTQEVRSDTPHFQGYDLESVMLDLKLARERLGKPAAPETDFRYALKTALEHYGKRMALHYFAMLLDSPYSRHLSRCDDCRAYFAYDRARLRTVKNGVFCSLHAPKGSVKRTERSRNKRLDTAAKAWIKRESSWKGQPDFVWIAEHVNKAHGTAFGRRWVAQNREKIEKRVEALCNAERKS